LSLFFIKSYIPDFNINLAWAEKNCLSIIFWFVFALLFLISGYFLLVDACSRSFKIGRSFTSPQKIYLFLYYCIIFCVHSLENSRRHQGSNSCHSLNPSLSLNPLSYITMKDYTTLEGSLSSEKVLGRSLNCREFDRGTFIVVFYLIYKYRIFYIFVFLYWDFLYYGILYLKILYSNFLYLIFLYCWFLYLFFLYFDFLYLRSKNPLSIFLLFYIMSGALNGHYRASKRTTLFSSSICCVVQGDECNTVDLNKHA
jgi:hypothetical protein